MTALLTVVHLSLTTLPVALFTTGYLMKSRRVMRHGYVAIAAGGLVAAVWWAAVGNWIAAVMSAGLCALAARRVRARR